MERTDASRGQEAPAPAAPRRARRTGRAGAMLLVLGTLLVVAIGSIGCRSSTAESGAKSGSASNAGAVAAGMAAGSVLVGGGAVANAITVMGTGSVDVPADQAVLSIGVETKAADAAKAADANAQAMNRVLEALKKAGVPDSAVQTAGVTVAPDYSTPAPGSGQQQPSGFRATNVVTVTVPDAAGVSRVFAAAATAGANSISGPSWGLADEAKATGAALEKAVAAARAKAEVLAKASGVRVGDVLALSESGTVGPLTGTFAAAEAASPTSVTPPPVNPGKITVTSSITASYAIAR
jgi:uncharacterized protein YggE